MMKENLPDIDEVNNLIENCMWRKDMCGIPVCKGEVAPCNNVIHSGKCDTLKQYFLRRNKNE